MIRETELKHYGVRGMKWGHRKVPSTSKLNEHISKINTSKTKLGKRYHNNRAYQYEYNKLMSERVNKAKGIKGKYSERYGSGSNVSRLEASANYYKRASGYEKGAKKTIAKNAAYNSAQYAKAWEKSRDAQSLNEKGKAYIDRLLNTKVKSYNRYLDLTKETTSGKILAQQAITAIALTSVQLGLQHKNNQ